MSLGFWGFRSSLRLRNAVRHLNIPIYLQSRRYTVKSFMKFILQTHIKGTFRRVLWKTTCSLLSTGLQVHPAVLVVAFFDLGLPCCNDSGGLIRNHRESLFGDLSRFGLLHMHACVRLRVTGWSFRVEGVQIMRTLNPRALWFECRVPPQIPKLPLDGRTLNPKLPKPTTPNPKPCMNPKPEF